MQINGTAPVLLRPDEAAAVLRIGRTKVFELIRTGELRSFKLGRARLVPSSAVAEYVNQLAGTLER
jgi:excisionase family DNA binding protein